MAIIKRGSSYGVRIWDPIRKKYEWAGTYPTYDDAKLVEIAAKRDPRRLGSETCGEFASRWLNDFNQTTRDGSPRWGKKSVVTMRGALKPFIATFGTRKLRALTTPEIRPWAREQPLKYVQVVRTMFNDAIREGLAQTNPFANLRLQHSRGRKDIIVLTEPEVERLCDLALDTYGEFGPTFAAMVATAAYSGMRQGELFALRHEDLFLDDEELHIRFAFNGEEIKGTKNERDRRIVLPPAAVSRIRQMPRHLRPIRCPACEGTGRCGYCHDERRVSLVFEPSRGGMFTRSRLYYYWRPLRASFSRPDMDWYELRHAGATMFIERGAEAWEVAKQLGHSKPKLIEELYGHPSQARIRERLKRAWDAPITRIYGADQSQTAEGGRPNGAE